MLIELVNTSIRLFISNCSRATFSRCTGLSLISRSASCSSACRRVIAELYCSRALASPEATKRARVRPASANTDPILDMDCLTS